VEKGFTLKDIGVVLHAKFHQDFGSILDKVQVTLYTDKKKVDELTKTARAEYKFRDERVEKMTDEDVEIFYSCTLCQSFAPTHVCTVSPERTGLCGAYNWMDCKASLRDQPHRPQPAHRKGRVPGSEAGDSSRGSTSSSPRPPAGPSPSYNFYSMVHEPMTTCGCCEASRPCCPAATA
jgi:acetyl-CoA synthase